jgi:protein-S-isoprenylcysteine O-methyltransferase Ste14
MTFAIRSWIEAAWIAVGVFWAVSAIGLKPVAKAQSAGSRLAEVIYLVLAGFLLFGRWPVTEVLHRRVFPQTIAMQWTGLLITGAGAVIAILARAVLGANWSGRATIKQGHELIRKGPYAFVRHPIYTGLLLAVIGTAVAFGEIRHLLAIPLTLRGFWIKIQEEERLLAEQFGEQYLAYRREVKGAIIPHIL